MSEEGEHATYKDPKDNEKEELENNETEVIKSRAIVKYSVPTPSQFAMLQCNTDLNLPPANWLSSSADSYGLQQVVYTRKNFSSFRIAHTYLEYIGLVDVVAAADDVKKILKVAYTKDALSMVVHRIGNTLLIDNFDIYKHFTQCSDESSGWIRKFISQLVGNKALQADRQLYIKDRTREALKNNSLVSKFLYYSLVGDDKIKKRKEIFDDVNEAHGSTKDQHPILPDPSPDVSAPDSDSLDHKYNRNVIWTFEDIEMLLGTDMPIFGQGTYPCISLRLRDMTTPINVLTGIDYWLDNLMSNVPEVVMCYHLNGIVQKYELIKTEDIPRLDNSKFSPKVIRDVAQNILSFLKTNATKAGHTYWLFKGKDEEIIKLYDLTCLVPQDEKLQNPFTIPVAMLLYRVALSFMGSEEREEKRPHGTIRMLLKNCLDLLSKEKYAEIVCASHYMLSEVYIPYDTNPQNPSFDDEEERDPLYEDYDDLTEDAQSSAIKELDLEDIKLNHVFKPRYKPPSPITGTVEERCLQSVNHLTQGLNCLQYFSEQEQEQEAEQVTVANPAEPIPMGYAKLEKPNVKDENGKKGKKNRDKKKKSNTMQNLKELDEKENALLVKKNYETLPLPTWNKKNTKKDGIVWKDHLKILLYEKALLVYATLSEYYYVSENYGASIRCIAILGRCSLIMSKLTTINQLRLNCLLGRAGDCCTMISNHWSNVDSYRIQYTNSSQEDLMLMKQLEQDERLYDINIGETNIKFVFIYDILSIEQMLSNSIKCYEEALKVLANESVLRRLANSLNEIGMYYLKAAKLYKEKKDLMHSARKAGMYLTRALEIFEKVKDEANVALLYINIAHLNRMFAYGSHEGNELTINEKHYFNKAFTSYKKALQVLGHRESNLNIWDNVNWELSTAYFTMAIRMQDFPPDTFVAEYEKEVIETLQKALSYCDMTIDSPKLPLYQYRAALIYDRIGSLYHQHAVSVKEDISNMKTITTLAKINYEKAAKFYFISRDAMNYLTVQAQKISLIETLAETVSHPNAKINHFQSCLDVLFAIKEMIDLLVRKEIEIPENEGNKRTDLEDDKIAFNVGILPLLKLVQKRMQNCLKNLLKLCSIKPPPNKTCPRLADIYRECYKTTFILKDDFSLEEMLLNLNNVLTKIKEITAAR